VAFQEFSKRASHFGLRAAADSKAGAQHRSMFRSVLGGYDRRKTEDGGGGTEDGRRKTGEGGRRTEDRRQRAEGGGR
jgi:hypothetical protein